LIFSCFVDGMLVKSFILGFLYMLLLIKQNDVEEGKQGKLDLFGVFFKNLFKWSLIVR
jgi:hypothetical protein